MCCPTVPSVLEIMENVNYEHAQLFRAKKLNPNVAQAYFLLKNKLYTIANQWHKKALNGSSDPVYMKFTLTDRANTQYACDARFGLTQGKGGKVTGKFTYTMSFGKYKTCGNKRRFTQSTSTSSTKNKKQRSV
jgi:hypothetical protein